MIAHILPVKRLPKHCQAFDYTVPAELTSSIVSGQLVTIPFRRSIVFGVVVSVASVDADTSHLKPISSIVHTMPLLSDTHLSLIDTVSHWYGIAPATAAKMLLPPLQKRKLAKITLAPFEAKRKNTARPQSHFFHYTNPIEHQTFLTKSIHGNTLILVPEVNLIDEVMGLLPASLQSKTMTFHSALSQKELFERWFSIRNNEYHIVIGTRGSVFLPFMKLDTILVDYEHDENHKHWDQAPRFHAKDVSYLLNDLYGATVYLGSFTPSIESYFHAHKKNYIEDTNSQPLKPITEVTIVDMRDERRAKNFNLFAETVNKAIHETAGDIFLFINRKGFATSIGCNDCGFKETCPTCKLPLIYHDQDKTLRCHYCGTQKKLLTRCPTCSSPMVELRGAGTELIETYVRDGMSNRPEYGVTRIDGDQTHLTFPPTSRRIIVGTEMALHYIRWEQTTLIVFLDIDKQLALPEFRSGDHVWHRIQEVLYRKNPAATFFIQTFHPASLVLRSLKEPDRFYRTELNSRQALGYPPYQYLVRYMYAGPTFADTATEANKLFARLSQKLTTEQKSIILHRPIEMHPHYYRGAYWLVILARLPPLTWQQDITFLNTELSDGWKIDPNPISLLSP